MRTSTTTSFYEDGNDRYGKPNEISVLIWLPPRAYINVIEIFVGEVFDTVFNDGRRDHVRTERLNKRRASVIIKTETTRNETVRARLVRYLPR